MPTFFLIRHGENEFVKKGRLAGRLPEVHLNPKGQSQAQALAIKLAGTPVSAIYSSPLERAMETAEPVAKALGKEIIQRPGLLEVNIGEWQGEKIKGLSRHKLWKLVQWVPSRMQFPGGETFVQAQQRMVNEFEELSRLHEPKDLVLCFSHSDPIKLVVAHYLGMPLDLFQRLAVSPASISVLHIGEGSSHLLALNIDLSFSLPKG